MGLSRTTMAAMTPLCEAIFLLSGVSTIMPDTHTVVVKLLRQITRWETCQDQRTCRYLQDFVGYDMLMFDEQCTRILTFFHSEEVMDRFLWMLKEGRSYVINGFNVVPDESLLNQMYQKCLT